MRKTKLLFIPIIIFLTSLSNLIANESTELSYGTTSKIDLTDMESFKRDLGFKSAQEVKNFLEAITEFYYQYTVLRGYYESNYCNSNNADCRKEVKALIREFRTFHDTLMKLKYYLEKKNFSELSNAISYIFVKGAGHNEFESFHNSKEFEPSLIYAKYLFPKLKENLNQICSVFYSKTEL